MGSSLCEVFQLFQCLVVRQDRFSAWEASNLKVIPVFSDPPEGWQGATGFVQVSCHSPYSPLDRHHMHELLSGIQEASDAGGTLCATSGHHVCCLTFTLSQAAYEKDSPIADGSKAGAVLCGHKGMAEVRKGREVGR